MRFKDILQRGNQRIFVFVILIQQKNIKIYLENNVVYWSRVI